ncbi:MAG: ADP-ribosylglycohydrolase family protein [Phycisphaerales bacterium]|nr:MAG: ADP-ribosylglycohydrolase family protein [Phycisphaerales bacterium]
MRVIAILCIIWSCTFWVCCSATADASSTGNKHSSRSGPFVEIPVETIEDKIRGGLLAQLLGNLNGLPHENKYYEEPGNVQQYTPGLPQGARTDDDTDIEWVYIAAMQKAQTAMLRPQQITLLWKKHINSHIWCSNLYVRRLMDVGINPPLTGSLSLNPWAGFNISGQFVCETFGLIAPAMPQTAARIGLNYTHVSIDGEPAQTTQLFTAMIATAFITNDIDSIIEAGLASIDPQSSILPIIGDVRRWHKEYPNDWRTTRRLIRDKYTLYESRTRNQNGYELCTAATIAALLYGEGDLVRTLVHAFNFGWDADNNAATAATVVGVIKGNRWIQQQGWTIKDRYRNTTRPSMPEDETITRFGDRIVEVAGLVIAENGGGKIRRGDKAFYRIRTQKPANIERLSDVDRKRVALRSELKPQVEAGLTDGAGVQEQARAAYLAICLGLAESLRFRDADRWQQALTALEQYPKLLDVLFRRSPGPAGDELRAAARAAGLKEPPG